MRLAWRRSSAAASRAAGALLELGVGRQRAAQLQLGAGVAQHLDRAVEHLARAAQVRPRRARPARPPRPPRAARRPPAAARRCARRSRTPTAPRRARDRVAQRQLGLGDAARRLADQLLARRTARAMSRATVNSASASCGSPRARWQSPISMPRLHSSSRSPISRAMRAPLLQQRQRLGRCCPRSRSRPPRSSSEQTSPCRSPICRRSSSASRKCSPAGASAPASCSTWPSRASVERAAAVVAQPLAHDQRGAVALERASGAPGQEVDAADVVQRRRDARQVARQLEQLARQLEVAAAPPRARPAVPCSRPRRSCAAPPFAGRSSRQARRSISLEVRRSPRACGRGAPRRRRPRTARPSWRRRRPRRAADRRAGTARARHPAAGARAPAPAALRKQYAARRASPAAS